MKPTLKLKTLTALAVTLPALLGLNPAQAASWTYDFGTGTGSFTSGASTTFLPVPPANGGTARVRVGTQGGSFNLENPGDTSVGSQTELRIVGPTGGSVNKFSISDYTTANTTFYVKFTVKMSGSASAGSWLFFAGDGASLSDNNGFTSSQVFTGVQWTFGSGTAIVENYRNGSSWSPLSGSYDFSKDAVYNVEVYGNNSSSAQSYYRGGNQTLAAYKWDLWVNGNLVGDDLTKGALANGNNVDSYMFYGESFSGNNGTLYLDDFEYGNGLPVTLTYSANGGTGSQTDPSSPYVAGTTVTVLGPGTIARSGYTFAGWNTAADGGGTPYNPSGTFIINANTTLYAQWCQNPTIFTVTGGDFYCSGGSGVEVGLDGSESGVSYQLYRNGGSTPVGSAVPGTGSAISFGNQTVADTYTVVGTRTVGGCSADMASSAVVVVTQDPLTWVHGNGAWDTGGSYWNDASSTAVTYCDGYNVIFGDSGTIDPLEITLDIPVSPASVNVNSSTIEYMISGSGSIAGAGGLTKAGSKACTLDTANTYTGSTTVNEGTLALGTSASIAESATISVAGGATFDVSAVSPFSLAMDQTLKGNGTVNGTVTVASGSTVAPGQSVGTLTTGNQTWEGGGTLAVEMASTNGSAGTDWDLLVVDGTLDINATSGSKFNVNLNLPGTFDFSAARCWRIVDATTITDFSADAFNFSSTPAADPLDGSFKMLKVDNSLYVAYVRADPASGGSVVAHFDNDGVQGWIDIRSSWQLTEVKVTLMVNCSIVGTAYSAGPASVNLQGPTYKWGPSDHPLNSVWSGLPEGTCWVRLVGTRLGAGQSQMQAVGYAQGTGGPVDPVITTLEVTSGGRVQQRFEGILAAESHLTVRNGSPGLRSLEVNLNGRVFRLDALGAGQFVASDLATAMREGEDNVLILTGYGDVGASALVTLGDVAGLGEVSLTETVLLTLDHTSAGLQLSWADTLDGWQLQTSGDARTGWVAAPLIPTMTEGRLSVTVPPNQGMQFFRLMGPNGAARGTAATDNSSAVSTAVNQPQPFTNSTHEGTW